MFQGCASSELSTIKSRLARRGGWPGYKYFGREESMGGAAKSETAQIGNGKGWGRLKNVEAEVAVVAVLAIFKVLNFRLEV